MYFGLDFGLPDDRGALVGALPVDEMCVEPLRTFASSSGSSEPGGVSPSSLSMPSVGVTLLIFATGDARCLERRLPLERVRLLRLRYEPIDCGSPPSSASLMTNAIGGSSSGSCTASRSPTISVARLRAMMCERADVSLRGTEITLTGTSPLSDVFSWSSCSTFRQ